MKNILIFGTSVFSKNMAYHLAETEKYNCVGFIVNKKYYDKKFFCNKKVYIMEELEDYFEKSKIAILPTLGYSEMNRQRKVLFDFCHEKEYEIASYIDETVLNHAKFIGEGNIIMDNVRLDYDCEIGDGNYIGHDATVAHDVKIGNFNYISGRTGFGGSVFLGDYNFLGMSSLIANDIKLGDMNLIGAGAYVRHSLCTHMVVTPAQERIVQTEDRMLMWMLKNH